MAITPVVRYMLVCDDWRVNPANSREFTIVGLISNIRSLEDPPYPLCRQEICVFLVLTEGRGQGQGKIVCTFDVGRQKVFETPPMPISFGRDPLEIAGVSFRIRDCTFPQPGLYSLAFWYDGALVHEQSIRMR